MKAEATRTLVPDADIILVVKKHYSQSAVFAREIRLRERLA